MILKQTKCAGDFTVSDFNLFEMIRLQPVVPYIRESDFAHRDPWRCPERKLLDYLLIYFQEGTCRVVVDREEYLFEKGQFCLVQPGSLVDLEGLTETVTPFAHFDVFYNPERERSFPTRPGQIDLTEYEHLMQPRLNDVYGLHIPVLLQPRNPLKLRQTLLHMIELWQMSEPMMQLRTQLIATEIIVELLETYLDTRQNQHMAAANQLNWVGSYLSVHLNEPLSIEDMARRANLSPSRFSALFKERYGVSPHRYLLDMRVNHAGHLLKSTKLTQEEIASYCGFADVHHFSKTFKKRTGQAPGVWRQA